jgi:hypothetical protein
MATLDITAAFSGGLGMSAANIVLASGLNFPDALVAAEFKSPIVLDASGLPPGTTAFLTTNAALIANIMAIGGTAVISAADLAAAQAAVSPTAGAATFTAVAGGTSFTVAFAAPINSPSGANFLLNNAALPALPAGSPQQTGASTYLVFGLGVLKPGDVISINGANPPTQASNNATVPASSFTVPANVAPAVVSANFFINGNALSVTFSKPVFINGGVTCTCGLGPLMATSQDGTTLTWGPTGAAIKSTDTLTISVAVTDKSAGLVPLPAAVTFTPSTNTVAPTISATVLSTVNSAPFTTVQGTSVASALTPGAALIITAKPGSAADGAAGGAFEIQAVAPLAGQVALNVTSGACQAPAAALGKTCIYISIPGGVYTTATAVGAALNANSTFNAILVANAAGASVVPATVGTAAAPTDIGPVAGGVSFFGITAVLSKQVVPLNLTNVANWTVSGGGAVLVVSLNNLAIPSAPTVIVQATTPAQVVTASSTVTFNAPPTVGATPVADFAGNAMPQQTVSA